eukprot:TRINITY_DN2260_c0_g1_i1.p1 TRINITY_DN2260_c0_g1~~TRINITY_DN2260_c0_g1_i1.p1  ORF type:complete len:268 (+),score=61.69 TRINITY_DN2260_c0_g1_i1:41-805(+)
MAAERDWRPLLLAGGALGVAGVLYFLFRDDEEEVKTAPCQRAPGAPTGQVPEGTKLSQEGGTVRRLITEMIQVQDLTNHSVQDMVREQLSGKVFSVEEAYKRVDAVGIYDPLEKYGLTSDDFEQMVTMFQGDPWVMQAMAKLAGAEQNTQPPAFSAETIVEVRAFMLQQMAAVVDQFASLPRTEDRSFKSAVLAMEALVNAKVEARFGIKVDDLNGAVRMKSEELEKNADFVQVMRKTGQVVGFLNGCLGSSAG